MAAASSTITTTGDGNGNYRGTFQLETKPFAIPSPDGVDKGSKDTWRNVIGRWCKPPGSDGTKEEFNGWKTTPYILGNEFSERMASFSLTWTLVLYLVQNYHLKRETAAYIISVFSGIIGLTPLLGGFIADTYLGRYRSIILGSCSYFLGLLTLLLTTIVPSLAPPKCEMVAGQGIGSCVQATNGQLYFLYMAFAFLAMGAAGLRPCLYAFGADQFPQSTPNDIRRLKSFFNWYYVGLTSAMFMASTVVAYIQLEVSWTWGFALPIGLVILSIFIFLRGRGIYRYVAPKGSPIIELARVAVAAYKKRHVSLPTDPSKLYTSVVEIHTNQFRFLDKAAILTNLDTIQLAQYETLDKSNKKKLAWRLCSVPQVENLKCVLRVLPIWVAGIMPGCYLVQQGVWLPIQASTMHRQLGSLNIPPSSMVVFSIIATIIWLPFYDKVIVPLFEKKLKFPSKNGTHGITLLQRIGIGYILLVFAGLISGGVEAKRRVDGHNMSALWLAPQMVMLGVAEGFSMVGQVEYMYQQMPSDMRSVAGAMFSCTIAIGSFVGSIILAIVEHVTNKYHQKWIDNERLSRGHLDYYYYVLATLLFLNFLYFLFISFGKNLYRPTPTSPPTLEDGISTK